MFNLEEKAVLMFILNLFIVASHCFLVHWHVGTRTMLMLKCLKIAADHSASEILCVFVRSTAESLAHCQIETIYKILFTFFSNESH